MGCEIISDGKMACFYCNTSMSAFGPAMSAEYAEEFQNWLEEDPRIVKDLSGEYDKFMTIKELENPCENCEKQEQQGYQIGDKEVCLDCYSGYADSLEDK